MGGTDVDFNLGMLLNGREASCGHVAGVEAALGFSRDTSFGFVGQGISLIGTWMTRVATAWLAYRLTHSALVPGVVSFSGQLPTFVFAPFAGVWVDGLNRHRVLVASQALAMLQSLSLAALALAKVITVIVPDEKRGRVMSYYTMAFVGMAPFGRLFAGSLASRIGAAAAAPGSQRRFAVKHDSHAGR